jgi:hypothetical protein
MHQTYQDLLDRVEQLSAQVQELRDEVKQAVAIADLDPQMSLTRARRALEFIVREVFERRVGHCAGTQPLENLLQRIIKDGYLPRRVAAYANGVRELGNLGTHSFGERISQSDVLSSLNQLTVILDWYFHEEWPQREAVGAPRDSKQESHPKLTHTRPTEHKRDAPSPPSESIRGAAVTTAQGVETERVGKSEPRPDSPNETLAGGRQSKVPDGGRASAEAGALASSASPVGDRINTPQGKPTSGRRPTALLRDGLLGVLGWLIVFGLLVNGLVAPAEFCLWGKVSPRLIRLSIAPNGNHLLAFAIRGVLYILGFSGVVWLSIWQRSRASRFISVVITVLIAGEGWIFGEAVVGGDSVFDYAPEWFRWYKPAVIAMGVAPFAALLSLSVCRYFRDVRLNRVQRMAR